MPTMSIVEDYIIRAIRRAEFERLEDGSVVAHLSGFPGLVALGPDAKSCLDDLWDRLDDWIRVSIDEVLPLPVLDGVDLNSEASRKLADYHNYRAELPRGRLFETDEEFMKSLDE